MPTFLFSDIENSTRLWEKYRAEMGRVLARHDAILSEEIARHGGRIIKHTGDGIFAVFEAGAPLQCALEVQKRLAGEDWGAIGELRVRLALHAGEAEKRGEDYFGPAINRTARVLAAGWGGQILFTPAVRESCELPAGASQQDLGFHFFKDLGEPQQIYGLLHPDLPLQEFPPLRSLSGHPHNLPPQPTPFLDREEELAEVARLLDEPACRLLTLIGPGGMGKTRLALQAAAEKVESYTHGVYFVPLAPLSSPEFLVSTIADALRFSFYSREDPKVQLFNYLHEKAMLLVMDNFEHLTAGAGLVAEILENAPRVKVLATSRERLNLQGEWIFPLNGMEVPEGEKVETIEGYSAIQLFLQSARRVQPDFVLPEEDRPFVIRACRLVEGVPLGIELASSWVRVLSCQEIVQEIEQNVDFLATALRDMPERHRSLRAVFDYSWALLSEEERRALRKLSVFRGGFRREAAVPVAGASLLTLAALVDKSLLRRDASGRHDVLEVLRQYAEEKLQQVPVEQTQTRDRHSAFYARFLKQQESSLKGSKQKEALEEISAEVENVRVAWRWAVERRDEEALGQALEGLCLFFEMRSGFQEGAETFGRAVEALRRTGGDSAVLGRLLARYGWCCERLGEFHQARRLFQESLAISRPAGDPGEVAFSLANLGLVVYRLGEYAQSKEILKESLTVAQEAGDLRHQAYALNNLGTVASTLGEYDEARRLYQDSLAIFKKIGYPRGIANTLNNLGVVASTLGDSAEAKRLYQESLAIFKETDDRRGIAYLLNNLGHVSEALGEYAETERLCQESLDIFREIGYRWGIANALNNLGAAACALGKAQESGQHFQQALETAMHIQAIPLALEALAGIAQLLVEEGRKERAVEVVSLVLHHPACDRETQNKAQKLLHELTAELPAEVVTAAQERVKEWKLEEAVQALALP